MTYVIDSNITSWLHSMCSQKKFHKILFKIFNSTCQTLHWSNIPIWAIKSSIVLKGQCNQRVQYWSSTLSPKSWVRKVTLLVAILSIAK
jgi:hypothetical protein